MKKPFKSIFVAAVYRIGLRPTSAPGGALHEKNLPPSLSGIAVPKARFDSLVEHESKPNTMLDLIASDYSIWLFILTGSEEVCLLSIRHRRV